MDTDTTRAYIEYTAWEARGGVKTTTVKDKGGVVVKHVKRGKLQGPTVKAPASPRAQEEGGKRYDYPSYADALSKRLGIKRDACEKVLRYWVRRSPPDYAEDALQDVLVAALQERPGSDGILFAIARHVVGRLWERWHTRQHYGGLSLDHLDAETGEALSEYVVGVVDAERVACGNIECGRLWGLLPANIKGMVGRRLMGDAVRGREAGILNRWALENAPLLLAS